MALAQDSLTTFVDQTDQTSASWSHTCSGENRLLLVFITCNAPSSSISCTYAGVSMTLHDSTQTTGGSQKRAVIFKLANPATGSNTVSISNITSGYRKGYSVSLTGVKQDTLVGTASKATGTSTTPSVNVSSATGERVYDIVASVGDGSSLSYTPGSGQTEVLDSNTLSYLAAAGSYEGGASTVTMSWTVSRSFDWAIIGVSVKPITTNIKSIYPTTYASVKKILGATIATVKKINGVT